MGLLCIDFIDVFKANLFRLSTFSVLSENDSVKKKNPRKFYKMKLNVRKSSMASEELSKSWLLMS